MSFSFTSYFFTIHYSLFSILYSLANAVRAKKDTQDKIPRVCFAFRWGKTDQILLQMSWNILMSSIASSNVVLGCLPDSMQSW